MTLTNDPKLFWGVGGIVVFILAPAAIYIFYDNGKEKEINLMPNSVRSTGKTTRGGSRTKKRRK